MAKVTKNIGLSLGADICWPLCYEEMMKRLALKLSYQGDTVSFNVERVSIEPFNLRQECKYSVVLDRLTHWYSPSREWLKKSAIMNGLYVLNNPWAVQSMEKQTSYCAMIRLGLPIPKTWLVPPKDYEKSRDLEPTLNKYARLFDLGKLGKTVGYPLFMKPYDGGGWVGVNCIKDEAMLRASYEDSGKYVMHLQEAVVPYDYFMRSIGLGPQVQHVHYDPDAPLHARYIPGKPDLPEQDLKMLEDLTLIINSFFRWDFNSCECLRLKGVWHPIDFANPCPDSQVTSLNWHFPWLVLANIRWSVFIATTGRKMALNQNWQPYFEIADQDIPYQEKIEAYTKLAHAYFELERFEEFCATHLAHVNEVAYEFFASDAAHDAVRLKVTALFPEHEKDEFTELFWKHIQNWRATLK